MAVGPFVGPITGRGQRPCGLITVGVGHFLHPTHDDHVMQAAGYGHITPAHGRPTGATGCFGRCGLDAAQPGCMGHQGAQVLLMGKHARKHVADVQSTNRFDAGIGQSGLYRPGGHFA